MKKLEMTKIRGGISWIPPMLPLPRDFKKKTIDKVKTNLGIILKQEGNSVKILDPDFKLDNTRFNLATVSGNIQGEIYYHTANPPVHSGTTSWPGYFGVELNVPDEKYSELKKSLKGILHPVRSAILGF